MRERIKTKVIQHLPEVLLIENLFILIFHILQYIKSGYNLQPLIRIIACLIFIPVALIQKGRWIRFFYYTYANFLIYLYDFTNYTPVFILVLALSGTTTKQQIIGYLIFITNTLLAFSILKRAPSHLALYFANAAAFYIFSLSIFTKTHDPQKLNLTPEQKEILEQLAEGKQQKEITTASKNTVTKKLKDACKKNNAATTGELLARFKSQREWE